MVEGGIAQQGQVGAGPHRTDVECNMDPSQVLT